MKLKFVLLALTLTLLVGNVTPTLYPFIIQMGINAALSLLDNFTLNDMHLEVPFLFQEIVIGTLDLHNLTIYGFDTKEFKSSDTVVKSLSDDVVNISLKLNLGKFGVETDYNADIGVLDLLPLYGNGKFNLAITKVNISLNLILSSNSTGTSIENLNLQLALRHSNESYITNLWNNSQVSEFLSNAIVVLEEFFSMWFNYEKDCINCVLSNLLEFIINLVLGSKTIQPSITCSCLTKTDLKIQENLENILVRLNNGELELLVEELKTNKDLIKIFYKVYDDILFVLKERNITL